MPEKIHGKNLTDLEKAVYIYIRLCKGLSYDENVYLSNQSAESLTIHSDPKHISKINFEHNKVIFFELTQIFARFLDELGIKYSFQPLPSSSADSLLFSCGKFDVRIDSMGSVLGGDLARAKMNKTLINFQYASADQSNLAEFNSRVSKIYNHIIHQELAASPFAEIFPELIDQTYKDIIKSKDTPFTQEELLTHPNLLTRIMGKISTESDTQDTPPRSKNYLTEKANYWIDLILNSDLKGLNKVALILNTYQSYFFASERKNLRIIKEQRPDGTFIPHVVVSLKDRFADRSHPEHNGHYLVRHFLFSPSQEIQKEDTFREIASDELATLLEQTNFSYFQPK